MNHALLAEAQTLHRDLHAAREHYRSLCQRTHQRERQLQEAKAQLTDSATLTRYFARARRAAQDAQQAHQAVGQLEDAAKQVYRRWLASLTPGDVVLTYSDKRWIEARVKAVGKASIKLANGRSFSNLTGIAWRGRTFLRMPAVPV